MPKEKTLGVKSSTASAFLNDKLIHGTSQRAPKIMNIDPKLCRKVFIYRG